MAQPELTPFSQRNLLLKIQAVRDVPEALDPNVDGFALRDGTSGTGRTVTRKNIDKKHFGAQKIRTSNKYLWIEGMFDLVPPTVPGHAVNGIPHCDRALRPGGMTRVLDAGNRRTRYNPITDLIPILTGAWYHAGSYYNPYNAQNQLSGLALEVGKDFEGKVRIQGQYQALDEAALPDVTLPEEDGEIVSSDNGVMQITLLPGGDPLNVWGRYLSIDFGSTVGTTEYTELKKTRHTGRDGKFTARFARTAKADFDPDALCDSGEFLTFRLRVTKPDGRYAELGVRCQVEDYKLIDIDGDAGYEITGPAVPSSTGNDEFWIEFGDVSYALSGDLSDGQEGVLYSGTTSLVVTPAITPLEWTVSAGTLPPGLTLDDSTGELSGTPTTANSYTFTLSAASEDGFVATSEQTIVIAAA